MSDSEQIITTAPEEVGVEASVLTNNLDIEKLQSLIEQFFQKLIPWAQSPQFYAQLALILAAIIFAYFLAKFVGKYFKAPSGPSQPRTMSKWRDFLYRLIRCFVCSFCLYFSWSGKCIGGCNRPTILVNQNCSRSFCCCGYLFCK
jgi:hypothetical protein